MCDKEERDILEEMADVQIMIWQMEHLLSANIELVIQKKIERQIERIEAENQNKESEEN